MKRDVHGMNVYTKWVTKVNQFKKEKAVYIK